MVSNAGWIVDLRSNLHCFGKPPHIALRASSVGVSLTHPCVAHSSTWQLSTSPSGSVPGLRTCELPARSKGD